MVGALFYHLGGFFSRILPRPLPQWLAWWIGQANWMLRWRTRRIIIDNLRVIHRDELSPRELRACARRVVMNFAAAIQIFLELPFFDWDKERERFDFSEFDAAVAQLAQGQAYIIASGHIGPWEVGAWYLSRKGVKLHTVALDHPSKYVTRFYSGRRALAGIQAHPLRGSIHALSDALESGECVALLIDRAYGKAKKRFTLFGVESEFPIGHLVLAARTQVPVLIGAVVFDGKGGVRYVHVGTRYPDSSLDEQACLEKLQDECLRDLEKLIRKYSDQWCYFKPLARTESYDA